MRGFAILLTIVACTVSAAEPLPRTASPEGARVYFISPKDGETVSGEFVVRFGLEGMGVAPAGIALAKTGHHHLLVDAKALPPLEQPIPADETHRHFGGGQTETRLSLPPGAHTLQLLLADHLHVPHDPPLASDVVHVTVK
jgi:hypothetical protein